MQHRHTPAAADGLFPISPLVKLIASSSTSSQHTSAYKPLQYVIDQPKAHKHCSGQSRDASSILLYRCINPQCRSSSNGLHTAIVLLLKAPVAESSMHSLLHSCWCLMAMVMGGYNCSCMSGSCMSLSSSSFKMGKVGGH